MTIVPPYTPSPLLVPTCLMRDAQGRTCAIAPTDPANPDYAPGSSGYGKGYGFDFVSSDDGGHTFRRHPIYNNLNNPQVVSIPPNVYISRLTNRPIAVTPTYRLCATGSGEGPDDWPKTNLTPSNVEMAAPPMSLDADTHAVGMCVPPHEPGEVCLWAYSGFGEDYAYGSTTALLRLARSFDDARSWPGVAQYRVELGVTTGRAQVRTDSGVQTVLTVRAGGRLYPKLDYPVLKRGRAIDPATVVADTTGDGLIRLASPQWKPPDPAWGSTWAQAVNWPDGPTEQSASQFADTDKFRPAAVCYGDTNNTLYVAGYCNQGGSTRYTEGNCVPYVAWSPDNGLTWNPVAFDPALDPACAPALHPIADAQGRPFFGYGAGQVPPGAAGYYAGEINATFNTVSATSLPATRLVFAQGTLYLAMYVNNTAWRMFRSGDQGRTWARCADPPMPYPPPPGSYAPPDSRNAGSVLGLAADNHRLLWNLTHHSDDDGQTWAAN